MPGDLCSGWEATSATGGDTSRVETQVDKAGDAIVAFWLWRPPWSGHIDANETMIVAVNGVATGLDGTSWPDGPGWHEARHCWTGSGMARLTLFIGRAGLA